MGPRKLPILFASLRPCLIITALSVLFIYIYIYVYVYIYVYTHIYIYIYESEILGSKVYNVYLR